jgi:hypothetical protein
MKMKHLLIALTLIACFTQAQGQIWQQIGQDIDGEAAGDGSGNDVSISSDGNTIAIGARSNDGAGHVRVYERGGTVWTQKGEDIDGEASDDQSGYSVSMSSGGNTLAIGAYKNDGAGTDAGHVRVYEWGGSAWSQKGEDIDGEASNDQSGYSVSMSKDGNTLAIGAVDNDGSGNSAGHVRVYEWSGSAWAQKGEDIDGETSDARSGWSVSMSSDGNTLAIGAPRHDEGAVNAGHVRVYEWSGSAWAQKGEDIGGGSSNDQGGYSVSMSEDGNTVAIAAPGDVLPSTTAAYVRVHEWSGSEWTQKGEDINGEAIGDNSGHSVSMSSDGNTIAIGAINNDGTASSAGHVRVYGWCCLTWLQIGEDIDGEASQDKSGYSVSLSSDGNALAIGAPYNDGAGTSAGHVRVFEYKSTNGVSESTLSNEVLLYPNPTNGDFSISLGENHKAATITISDLRGRVVRSISHNEGPLRSLRLDAPNGVYLLKIASGNEQAVFRLVKE